MAAGAKKPEINQDCLIDNKQATKKITKISPEEEKREDELLVYPYFMRGQFRR